MLGGERAMRIKIRFINMNFLDKSTLFANLVAIGLSFYLIVFSEWNILTIVWGSLIIFTVILFDVVAYQSFKIEIKNIKEYYSESSLMNFIQINPFKIRSRPPLVEVPGEMFD